MVSFGYSRGRASMSEPVRQDVVCVVGPTAVGKSSIAEEVALRINGEVVSVDSMQVYRGMDIGTAKVPPEERRCPLHMVDMVHVSEAYSVARFQHDARACIEGLHARGKVAVLCGGTGLYLDAVIDTMSFPHGELAGKVRSPYEQLVQEEGAEAAYQLLAKRDPQSARTIHPNNARRVVRALEMLDEGVSYAEHHQGLKRRAPYYPAHIWALSLERSLLYERINTRVDAMFAQGLVDEVKSLMAQGLSLQTTAGMAIGYKEIETALAEGTSLEEAKELIKRNSRRFAKRQLSWIRRDGRGKWLDLTCLTPSLAIDRICTEWEKGHRWHEAR